MANTERMKMPPTLPGTSAQQALLRSIIDAYNGDQRVLAIGVLGSLGRGTWDEWSDLDLDVVVTDDAALNAVSEARALCAVLNESEALVVPSRPGEVDVVLPSLDSSQFVINAGYNQRSHHRRPEDRRRSPRPYRHYRRGCKAVVAYARTGASTHSCWLM